MLESNAIAVQGSSSMFVYTLTMLICRTITCSISTRAWYLMQADAEAKLDLSIIAYDLDIMFANELMTSVRQIVL